MLENLKFSIPLSITINAPIDVVWDALTDMPSHPQFLSGVARCTSIDDPYYGRRSSHGSYTSTADDAKTNVNVDHGNTINNDAGSVKTLKSSGSNPRSVSSSTGNRQRQKITRAEMASKWKVTRISVFENQEYSANITITQYSEEENCRSFTMSTHDLLGATSSLKLTVESIPSRSSGSGSSRNWLGKNNSDNKINNERNSTNSGDPSSQDSAQNSKSAEASSEAASRIPTCQVTAIMTMIPYQFFVKLLGIMCCLCLLKYRARIAMECDLEDLLSYCEGIYQQQKQCRDGEIAGGECDGGGNGVSAVDVAGGVAPNNNAEKLK